MRTGTLVVATLLVPVGYNRLIFSVDKNCLVKKILYISIFWSKLASFWQFLRRRRFTCIAVKQHFYILVCQTILHLGMHNLVCLTDTFNIRRLGAHHHEPACNVIQLWKLATQVQPPNVCWDPVVIQCRLLSLDVMS